VLVFATTQPTHGEAMALETLLVFTERGIVRHDIEHRMQIVLGRSSACDVVVDSPSVSREHLRITLRPRPFVEDLGSANGTRVGGIALTPGERVPLGPGILVELGSVALALKSAGSSISDAAFDLGAAATSMSQLIAMVERFARTNLTILISGETGAGKEIMAESIHRASARADGPLLRLNCAAFTESVLESELFGHERGAFTGAVSPKPGLFELASAGTAFLDEIADLSLRAQAKVLRVLEDRKVWRVGAVQPRSIDVRFLAATHRDLEAEVRKGTFRQDLLFRLNAISLTIPPLRQRREEIAPFAERFLAEAAGAERACVPRLSDETRALLEAYAWPGNVRELRNTMTRALAMCDGDVIMPCHVGLRRPLPPPNPGSPGSPPDRPPAHQPSALREDVEALERQRIAAALAMCKGNCSKAAKLLGIARNTLASRIQRFNIVVER
jgi:two-component system, NtrC family, response regulator AtoC